MMISGDFCHGLNDVAGDNRDSTIQPASCPVIRAGHRTSEDFASYARSLPSVSPTIPDFISLITVLSLSACLFERNAAQHERAIIVTGLMFGMFVKTKSNQYGKTQPVADTKDSA
jgi:hypothetical protein